MRGSAGRTEKKPIMFAIRIKRAAVLLAALTLQLAFLTTIQSSPRAAELIMFEQRGCPYCADFDREIAPVYPLTEEGRGIPLRRVDIARPVPSDLRFIAVERFTPVFVLVDAGREIGRIRGYAGEDHFWGLFGVLVQRLRTQGAATGAASKARLAAPPQP